MNIKKYMKIENGVKTTGETREIRTPQTKKYENYIGVYDMMKVDAIGTRDRQKYEDVIHQELRHAINELCVIRDNDKLTQLSRYTKMVKVYKQALSRLADTLRKHIKDGPDNYQLFLDVESYQRGILTEVDEERREFSMIYMVDKLTDIQEQLMFQEFFI